MNKHLQLSHQYKIIHSNVIHHNSHGKINRLSLVRNYLCWNSFLIQLMFFSNQQMNLLLVIRNFKSIFCADCEVNFTVNINIFHLSWFNKLGFIFQNYWSIYAQLIYSLKYIYISLCFWTSSFMNSD